MQCYRKHIEIYFYHYELHSSSSIYLKKSFDPKWKKVQNSERIEDRTSMDCLFNFKFFKMTNLKTKKERINYFTGPYLKAYRLKSIQPWKNNLKLGVVI